MKLTIEIEMDNAAFDGDPADEVARILTEYKTRVLLYGEFLSLLKDINGNLVGSAVVKRD